MRGVLPDDFVWNPQDSPLRYQAVNDQSLQSLKAITAEALPSAQSLYAAFDVVRNRRSDGDNFVLQLYVYGTWMALLKHPQSATPQLKHFLSTEPVGSAGASVSSLKPVQLECVSLEMKVNGAFVRAEFSKRSFLAALRACQAADDDAEEVEEEEEADDDEDEDDDHEHEHEQDLN